MTELMQQTICGTCYGCGFIFKPDIYEDGGYSRSLSELPCPECVFETDPTYTAAEIRDVINGMNGCYSYPDGTLDTDFFSDCFIAMLKDYNRNA